MTAKKRNGVEVELLVVEETQPKKVRKRRTVADEYARAMRAVVRVIDHHKLKSSESILMLKMFDAALRDEFFPMSKSDVRKFGDNFTTQLQQLAKENSNEAATSQEAQG